MTSDFPWRKKTKLWLRRAGLTLAVLAIGPAVLAIGINEQREHRRLADHGVVVTGVVIASGGNRRRDWADVQWTTVRGETVVMRVLPIDGETDRSVGARIRVLYDPADPSVNADVHDGAAARHRWLTILSGAAFSLGGILMFLQWLRRQIHRRQRNVQAGGGQRAA